MLFLKAHSLALSLLLINTWMEVFTSITGGKWRVRFPYPKTCNYFSRNLDFGAEVKRVDSIWKKILIVSVPSKF